MTLPHTKTEARQDNSRYTNENAQNSLNAKTHGNVSVSRPNTKDSTGDMLSTLNSTQKSSAVNASPGRWMNTDGPHPNLIASPGSSSRRTSKVSVARFVQ